MFIIEEVPSKLKSPCDILALGSDTCQQISFARKGKIFSLRPRKDFKNPLDFYLASVTYLTKKFSLNPRFLAYDPHPLFSVKEAARILQKNCFPEAVIRPVFHHIAHVANFGIEAGLEKEFIGVAFDGTGFGQDGRVWGGEFFCYDKKVFRRLAHFEYQPLPGNEAAIYNPWRIAASILWPIYGKRIKKLKLAFLKGVPQKEFDLVCELIDKNFNAPLSSSVGRLFDAASALLNIKPVVKKEAEAAMALEKAARGARQRLKPYSFTVSRPYGVDIIGVAPVFKQMTEDVLRKKKAAGIAYRFHATIADIVVDMSQRLAKAHGIKNIYLSGGVFMNHLLRQLIEEETRKKGLNFIFGKKPQITDLGISQGQIAAVLMQKEN